MQACFFITGFLIVLAAVITFITFVARRLSGKISHRAFSIIEGIIIAGILLGVVIMVQPWTMAGYRLGFHMVLYSALAFTVWSHVVPKSAHNREQTAQRGR